MRLDINLATHAYEDAREFWMRWGPPVAALALITLFLLGWTLRNWSMAGRDRQNIVLLQEQINERDRERGEAQAFLDMSVNRSTRDQSQFLNELIRRKAFSWTRVFEDLEQVMPSNLHVTSLRPEFNDQNQMQLDVRVVGDTRGAVVELIHRMEGSRHFRSAQLMTESMGGDAASAGQVVASVNSIYVPDVGEKGGR
jgi:type IV pilus assembly protein PilN